MHQLGTPTPASTIYSEQLYKNSFNYCQAKTSNRHATAIHKVQAALASSIMYQESHHILPRAFPYVHMSGCQNVGPFLGTLKIWRCIILGIQKGTILLTTTHINSHPACEGLPCKSLGPQLRVYKELELKEPEMQPNLARNECTAYNCTTPIVVPPREEAFNHEGVSLSPKTRTALLFFEHCLICFRKVRE